MSQYDRRYQVKQLLGFVMNERGCQWMVLVTGDPKVWLFCQGYPDGACGNRGCFVATGLQHPVEKRRLVDIVRQSLESGLNVDMGYNPPLTYSDRLVLQHVEMRRTSQVNAEIVKHNQQTDVPPPPKRVR